MTTTIQKRGVVAVVPRGERLLLIRRSANVVAPGAYCFPGGAIETGEDEPTALIREVREELGVAVTPVRRLWQSVTPWGVALAWWRADLHPESTPTPNPMEVADFAWHTPDEMTRLPDLLESNHHFLSALASGDVVL